MPPNKIHIKQIDGLQTQLSKSLTDILNVGNTASQHILMGSYSIGIGVVNPNSVLDVRGSIRFDNLSSNASSGYVLQSIDALGNLDWVDVNTIVNLSSSNGIFATSNSGGGSVVPQNFSTNLTDSITFKGADAFGSTSFKLYNVNNEQLFTAQNNGIIRINGSGELEDSALVVRGLTANDVDVFRTDMVGAANIPRVGIGLPILTAAGATLHVVQKSTISTNGAVVRFEGLIRNNDTNNPRGSVTLGFANQVVIGDVLVAKTDSGDLEWDSISSLIGGVDTGIYKSSGTIPSGVVATITDSINFDGGKFGIGITPSSLFDVNGSVRFRNLSTTPSAGYVLQSSDGLGNADWVDIGSVIGSGATLDDTFRYDGSAWISTSDVTIDSSGNMAVGGNVIIQGDVTINGTTSTINTQNLLVEDPLILLASTQSGTPTLDSGLMIGRGSGVTQSFIWDESEDEFAIISTNDSADVQGNVNILGYSTLRLGGFKLTDGTQANGYIMTSDVNGVGSWVAPSVSLNIGNTNLSISDVVRTLDLNGNSINEKLQIRDSFGNNITEFSGDRRVTISKNLGLNGASPSGFYGLNMQGDFNSSGNIYMGTEIRMQQSGFAKISSTAFKFSSEFNNGHQWGQNAGNIFMTLGNTGELGLSGNINFDGIGTHVIKTGGNTPTDITSLQNLGGTKIVDFKGDGETTIYGNNLKIGATGTQNVTYFGNTVNLSCPSAAEVNLSTGFRISFKSNSTTMMNMTAGVSTFFVPISLTNKDLILNNTKIGLSTAIKIGFYGATPITQPAAITTTQGIADTLTNLGLLATSTIIPDIDKKVDTRNYTANVTESISHTLSSTDLIIQCYDSSGSQITPNDIVITGATGVNINFTSTLSSIKTVIIG